MLSSYGLAFWYGSKLVESGEMDAGKVTTVFFAIIIGAMAVGQATPNLSAFASARGGASHIFHVIDKESEIDPFSEDGTKVYFVSPMIKTTTMDTNYKHDIKKIKKINNL